MVIRRSTLPFLVELFSINNGFRDIAGQICYVLKRKVLTYVVRCGRVCVGGRGVSRISRRGAVKRELITVYNLQCRLSQVSESVAGL